MINHEASDNEITLVGDDGSEVLAEVLFTFEKDGENFVLLTEQKEYDDSDDEDNIEDLVLAYKYHEKEDGTIGELIPIEDDQDWDVVEETLNTFQATNFEHEEDNE